jgi:hypothetical protein
MPETSKSFKEFERAFRTFSKDLIPLQVSLVQKKVSFEALSRFVRRTPSDKGWARGNWQASIGSPKTGEIDADDTTRSGSPTISREMKNLAVIPPYSIVYITNNVPYIGVLDEGGFTPSDPGPSEDPRPSRKGRILVKGGYSIQSPEGIVAVTLQELRFMFP